MARGVEVGRGFIAVDMDDSAAKNALSGFGSFAASVFKSLAIAVGVAGGAVIKMAFDFNSLKEQSLIAFETLLGSGQKAQQMFTNLQKFAASTPFELPGLVDNARQLLGVGVAGDKVIPTLQALGDTAGALGINQEHFNNILLATTQAMGKGKLQGEELMQMVENGIPVWQLLAKATGKPIPELQKMSSEGKLLAADVLPKLFAQMEKDYGGSMAKQATTLIGVWSSLKDNTKILAGTALAPLFELVKSGVGTLGNFAQSQAGQDFAKNFASGLQDGITAGKRFVDFVKNNFGDDIRNFFDKAKVSAGHLWDTFKGDGIPIIKDLGSTLAKILPSLVSLGSALGGIIKPALEALRIVFDAVAANAGNFANLIGTAATVAGSIAGPAIQLFGTALKVVATIIGDLLNFVGDLSGAFGGLAGVVLGGLAAWRLFGPAIGGVATAISTIKPDNVAKALTPMSKQIDKVSLSAGVMGERLGLSSNAAEKVATTGSKVGTVLQKAGSYLPVVGLGFAALGLIWGAASQHAEDLHKAAESLGKGLAVGGSAADAAKTKIAELQKTAADAQKALDGLGKNPTVGGSGRFSSTGNEVFAFQQKVDTSKKAVADAKIELDKYTATLGPVGLAQARVSQAQDDYNAALAKFGPTSAVTINAHKDLVAETGNLNQAQIDAARSTKTEEQNLYDLTTAILTAANVDLQLRQSQQGVKEAMDKLNEVMHDGKATDDDRTNAQLGLESAMLRSAEAARKKGEADAVANGVVDTAKAGQASYTAEILRMGVAAGDNAPQALQKLVSHLSYADLTAQGAKVSIDGAGNAVIHLPDGKTIKVAAENASALKEIAEVQTRLDETEKHAQITMHVRLAGGLPAISNLKVDGQAADYGGRARGGSINAGSPMWVGEEGPELIYPDRAAFVADHQQSQQIRNGSLNGGSGGDTWNIYGTDDPYATALYVDSVSKFQRRLR